MNITIIGAGSMGRGIGMRAAAGGHAVTYVDKDPAEAEKLAHEINAAGGKAAAAALDEFQPGDMVVLAIPYGANIETVKNLGDRLKGRVVVDIANPLKPTFDGLATAPGTSSAEEVAHAAAPGAQVVKAFNTTFAGTLVSGEVAGRPLDVFIAGDDPAARERVAQFARDGGMRPVDVGPLSRARQVEGMQFLHIITQGTLGSNWGSTIKFLD